MKNNNFHAFAVIAMCLYSIPCLLWPNSQYEIWLRFFGLAMCFIILICPDKAFKHPKLFFTYWQLVLTYILSFCPFYMAILKDFSDIFLINLCVATFALTILTNWKQFLFINALGYFLAILCYLFIYPKLAIDYQHKSYDQIIYAVIAISTISYVTFRNTHVNLEIISRQNRDLEQAKKVLSDNLNEVNFNNSLLESDLERAIGMKKEIFCNVSHERRTPLHSIGQMIEILEEWNKIPEFEINKIIKMMGDSCKRLTHFVGNLLEAAKIDENKLFLNIQKYDMSQMIIDVVSEFQIIMKDRNIAINLRFNREVEYVIWVDEIKIKQVIRNLISNALKYTNEGDITISLKKVNDSNQDSILLTVKDQGIGIPESELSSIFEPFIQSSKNKNSAGGTGLGLAICNGIVKIHKGKIWAENNSNFYGSKFFVRLPILEPEEINCDSLDSSQLNIYEKPLLVIVDDEEIITESLKIILRSNNYDIVSFTNPIKALEFLEINPQVKLIILDIMMPQMHGTKFIKKMQQNEILQDIPVIVQSGMADLAEIKLLKKMGIKQYISKPYNKEIITNAVKDFLC